MFGHFVSGFRTASRYWRITLIYYVTNVLFTLLAIYPLWHVLKVTTGRSLIGDHPTGLLNGVFIADSLAHHSAPLSAGIAFMMFILVVFILFRIFLAGGTFSVLESGERYNPKLFWGGAGGLFLPYVRHFVCMLVPLLGFMVPVVLFKVIGEAVAGHDALEGAVFKVRIATAVAFLLFFTLWVRAMDYGRMYLVRQEKKKAIDAALAGLRIFWLKFAKAVGLSVLFGLCATAIWWVYANARGIVPPGTADKNLVLALALQVTVVLRVFVRVSGYAGHHSLFSTLGQQPFSNLPASSPDDASPLRETVVPADD